MAQKVSITLVDDIDESVADETVSFALDGKSYEIDLTAAHAAQLRDGLALFVAHARKSAGARRGGRRVAAAGGAPAGDIREWAKQNGHDVSERGRIPAELRELYDAAH